MHHPTDRIAHTTAFVTPVVEHWLEREIAQWVHPMKDQSDNPSHHERTLLPRSYISLPQFQGNVVHLGPTQNALQGGACQQQGCMPVHLTSVKFVLNITKMHVSIGGSILHAVNPLSYLSFQPVLHDWCNKGRGMCYPVCGMVHIKEPLLLIDKSSLCGGSGFPFSLSEWSLTICVIPYNCK